MPVLVEVTRLIPAPVRLVKEKDPLFQAIGNGFEVYGKMYINPAQVVAIVLFKDDLDKEVCKVELNNKKIVYTDKVGGDALK